MNEPDFTGGTPRASFAAWLNEDGSALIESYRANGSVEELFVLEAPTEPIQHNDDRCPPNCECNETPNE